MNTVVGGAQDAAVVLAGEAVSGMVPALLKQDPTTPMGMAIRGGAGIGLAMLAGMLKVRFLDPRLIVAGAFVGIGRTVVRRFKIPFFSTALSAYPGYDELAAYPTLEAYPATGGELAGTQQVDPYGTSLAAWPQYNGVVQ